MLYTIGYAGYKDFDELYRKLKDNQIEQVVDVRANPYCKWKADFTGEYLDLCLNLKKILYVWYPQLGVPSDVRTKHDYEEIKELYKFILKNNEKTLKVLGEFAEKINVCLLCAEKSADRCHRKWIAEWIVNNNKNLEVKHL